MLFYLCIAVSYAYTRRETDNCWLTLRSVTDLRLTQSHAFRRTGSRRSSTRRDPATNSDRSSGTTRLDRTPPRRTELPFRSLPRLRSRRCSRSIRPVYLSLSTARSSRAPSADAATAIVTCPYCLQRSASYCAMALRAVLRTRRWRPKVEGFGSVEILNN